MPDDAIRPRLCVPIRPENTVKAFNGDTLRLLRMAVQHAEGEAVTALPDPSGGVLQWTVGTDGAAELPGRLTPALDE